MESIEARNLGYPILLILFIALICLIAYSSIRLIKGRNENIKYFTVVIVCMTISIVIISQLIH
ncbi:hypothetical protein PCURB6_43000 [Paenibacillus curdlanolyticus]|nr:hypothetical protein PCURB6_43000 [Paenibacillus curdlanolyticus]